MIDVVSIPYLSIFWTGIGFVCMLIGFFALAYNGHEEDDYTGMESQTTQELFAYFLEEEEKKNEALRQSVKMGVHQNTPVQHTPERQSIESESLKSKVTTRPAQVLHPAQEETKLYDEIIRFSEEGISVEDIAKKVNKGKGEVQLMLSLYKMR